MKILFLIFGFLFITENAYSYNNLDRRIYLSYEISDILLEEIYIEELHKYPIEKLNNIVESIEFKKILVVNITYFICVNSVTQENYFYFIYTNKFFKIKNVMKMYIMENIDMF